MADQPLSDVVHSLIEKMREPLGLDRWTIKVEFGPGDDTAACSAMPEYRVATISVNPDRLQTGDELDETICHELSHAITWPLADVADDLAIAVAELLPESQREAMAKFLKEQARRAEEETTTSVGHALIRVLRRWWKAEAELKKVEGEVRALKKQIKDAA